MALRNWGVYMNNRNIPITKRIADEVLQARKDINFRKEIAKDDENVKGSFNKIIGNLVASTFRKYISYILNYYGYNYKVSNVNAYIKNYPTEWDLIILKNDAIETNTNVYNANDVVAVLEFKTSGLADKDIPKQFDNQFSNLYNIKNKGESDHKIVFGYITFSETPTLYEDTKKYFDDRNEQDKTTFVFTNFNKMQNKYDLLYDECSFNELDNSNFEEYLLNLLGL